MIPSVHRGTGNGIAVGVNRIMGILSAIVATEADVSYSIAFIASSYFMLILLSNRQPLQFRSSFVAHFTL